MPGIFETLAVLINEALDPNASDRLPLAPAVIGDLRDWDNNLRDLSVQVTIDLNKLQQLLEKFKMPDDSVVIRFMQLHYPGMAERCGVPSLIGGSHA